MLVRGKHAIRELNLMWIEALRIETEEQQQVAGQNAFLARPQQHNQGILSAFAGQLQRQVFAQAVALILGEEQDVFIRQIADRVRLRQRQRVERRLRPH